VKCLNDQFFSKFQIAVVLHVKIIDLELHKILVCSWILTGKAADPRRKCLERKAALDNNLPRNASKLTRKKASTIAKTDVLRELTGERSKDNPNKVSTQQRWQLTMTKFERPYEKDKAEILIGGRDLKSKAAKCIQRVKFAVPKCMSNNTFLKRDPTSYQYGRLRKNLLKVSVARHLRCYKRNRGY
jgi:hypothetical protein